MAGGVKYIISFMSCRDYCTRKNAVRTNGDEMVVQQGTQRIMCCVILSIHKHRSVTMIYNISKATQHTLIMISFSPI